MLNGKDLAQLQQKLARLDAELATPYLSAGMAHELRLERERVLSELAQQSDAGILRWRRVELRAKLAEVETDLEEWADGPAGVVRGLQLARTRLLGELAEIEANIVREAGRAARLPTPQQWAQAFLDLLAAQPGAPRASYWESPDGKLQRIYFAGKQYLDVTHEGALTPSTRGRYHFLDSNLYPSQRRAFHAAMRAYTEYREALLADFHAEEG